MAVAGIVQRIETLCRGKAWWWRCPLLVYFAVWFFAILTNQFFFFMHPLEMLNLAIHESGHVICAYSHCGTFWTTAAGTIAEIAAPLWGTWNFSRQNDLFAMMLCFGWLATVLFGVSMYVADVSAHLAGTSQMTFTTSLLLPGAIESMYQRDWNHGNHADVGHDWVDLLGSLNLLEWDCLIAGGFWVFGVLAMLICLLGGAYILRMMAVTSIEK
jgi:hypothetical protein